MVGGGRPNLMLAQVKVFCPGPGPGQDLTEPDLDWDLDWDLDLSLTIIIWKNFFCECRFITGLPSVALLCVWMVDEVVLSEHYIGSILVAEYKEENQSERKRSLSAEVCSPKMVVKMRTAEAKRLREKLATSEQQLEDAAVRESGAGIISSIKNTKHKIWTPFSEYWSELFNKKWIRHSRQNLVFVRVTSKAKESK